MRRRAPRNRIEVLESELRAAGMSRSLAEQFAHELAIHHPYARNRGVRTLAREIEARGVEYHRAQTCAGALLTVVAPQLVEEFDGLQGASLVRRPYAAADLRGMMLVVAATDNRGMNAQVAADATRQGVLVNVVDDPQHCTFVMPSIVDRSPLLVAISTAGAAPVLARMLRGEIEALLPPSLGALSELLSRHRRAIKTALPDLGVRRRFMEALLEGRVAELIYEGDHAAAEAELLRQLATPTKESHGLVTVVGTGPGDPDLLTFQAQRFMQQADHVFYEVEVADAILERCRRDAERRPLEDVGGANRSRWSSVAREVERGCRVAVLVRGDGTNAARELKQEAGDSFRPRHIRGLPTDED